jgi:UDP-N-acetylglucosamine 2-epimerase (non-hydrolysing)
MLGVSELLEAERPDFLVVQGDTTTAFIAALAAFYQKLPVVHVEAGLRSNNPMNPFPEEMNRRLIGGVAALHAAPTPRACKSLLAEGVARDAIAVTGNTVIDALHTIVDGGKADPTVEGLPENHGRLVLVTLHRRESWGDEMTAVCRGLRRIAEAHSDITMVMPVHMNPNVRDVVMPILGDHDRIILTKPVPYPNLVGLIRASHLVITDSGGIQEEAPAFGKPVLVARKTTERPEAVEANCAKLVGTDEDLLVREANSLLTDDAAYQAMVRPFSPFCPSSYKLEQSAA